MFFFEKIKLAFRLIVQPFVEMKQIFGLTMFIGLFVSVLFFIAAGSMLYFKLFTEFQEDREQFIALKRIGLTDGELKKIVTTHIGMIFFLPFGVGVVHAAFALKTLGDIVDDSSVAVRIHRHWNLFRSATGLLFVWPSRICEADGPSAITAVNYLSRDDVDPFGNTKGTSVSSLRHDHT